MEEKTKLLFKEYLSLTETEKKAFENTIKEYNSKSLFEQRHFSDAFNKSLGPIFSAKCSVCGK